MSTHRFRTNHPQAGFSLLEVMIAVLVLSLGLLGLAALQGYSLQNNQSANHRTHASNLAYELIDSIRANPAAIPQYVGALDEWTDECDELPDEPPAACLGATPDVVDCDIARWVDQLCRALPNGRGRIEMAQDFSIPIAPVWNINVEVCWADNRAEYTESTEDCEPDPTADDYAGESLVEVTSIL